jgi:sec-independent protein translocase protein TatC
MGDDSESHGSRPDQEGDSAADTDAVVEADPASQADPEERSDSVSEPTDDTPDATDGESVTDERADEALDGVDDSDDGSNGTDWTTYAAGDRDEDGMPNPTPPPADFSEPVDATEDGDTDANNANANNADFDFGAPQVDDRVEADEEGVDASAPAAAETPPVVESDGTADAQDAPASGAAVADPTGTEVEPAYDPTPADEDDDFFDGPDSDVEMPLADHIEEMVRRLGIVFLIAGVVGVVVFPIADDLVNFLWNTHIPGATTIESRRPRLYGPLELILTELKVAGLAGFVVGLPVFVYQTYRFMRPGLYPKERKYYLAAVPTSLILAFIGVAFAHFVVLPAIFAYFTSYTIGTAVIAFGLKETFGLILVLMGYMALVFQIPLFIMLAIMMNLVTRQWLAEKRLLFWGGFLGLSFLVSPDPTGMAPIIVAATMITLFEGTLLLLRWVDR